MAAQQNFRTAFNGFNREDVVHYIEYLNSKHTAEVNQLKSEVEFLRTRTAAEAPEMPQADLDISQQVDQIRELMEEVKALKEEIETLRAEKEEAENLRSEAVAAGVVLEDQLNTALAEKKQLRSQLDEAIAAGTAIEAQMNAAMAEKEQMAGQVEDALKQQNTYKSRMEDELAAYRRAERAERLATERANQMYRQAGGVLADATVKVDETAAKIGELSDVVMAQLQMLQEAVAGSTNVLRDAAATMYTIRPEAEE